MKLHAAPQVEDPDLLVVGSPLPARMTRKLAPKPDDPEESKRFVDMAREIEVDENPEAFDKAFKKFVSRQEKNSQGSQGRKK